MLFADANKQNTEDVLWTPTLPGLKTICTCQILTAPLASLPFTKSFLCSVRTSATLKNTYDSMMVVFTINILLFEKFLCNFAVVTGSSLCFPKVAWDWKQHFGRQILRPHLWHWILLRSSITWKSSEEDESTSTLGKPPELHEFFGFCYLWKRCHYSS